MHSSLLASVVVMEFQTTETYSSLDLIKVKYNVYRQSSEENEKVKVQTSPNILYTVKKCSQHDYGISLDLMYESEKLEVEDRF
jgi:hypothetical protein